MIWPLIACPKAAENPPRVNLHRLSVQGQPAPPSLLASFPPLPGRVPRAWRLAMGSDAVWQAIGGPLGGQNGPVWSAGAGKALPAFLGLVRGFNGLPRILGLAPGFSFVQLLARHLWCARKRRPAEPLRNETRPPPHLAHTTAKWRTGMAYRSDGHRIASDCGWFNRNVQGRAQPCTIRAAILLPSTRDNPSLRAFESYSPQDSAPDLSVFLQVVVLYSVLVRMGLFGPTRVGLFSPTAPHRVGLSSTTRGGLYSPTQEGLYSPTDRVTTRPCLLPSRHLSAR